MHCIYFLNLQCYTILYDGPDKSQVCKNKGIPQSFVKNHLRFANYKNCLFNQESSKASYYKIRSRKHQLRTIEEKKTCLTPMDDKV